MNFISRGFLTLTCVVLLVAGSYAQTPPMPDSLLVIKNRIKVASISTIGWDGKPRPYKIYTYDSLGRVIREREKENYYYREYVHDSLGRRKIITDRLFNGKFSQRFVYSWNSKDSTTYCIVYALGDSIRPWLTHLKDDRNRTSHAVYYSAGYVASIKAEKYDSTGTVIAVYDSSAVQRCADWSVNGLCVARKTYDHEGKILHSYRFFYEHGRITRFTDSTGVTKTVEYTFTYDKGELTEYRRDKTVMDQNGIDSLRKEFRYIFPYDNGLEEENIPSPAPIIEHNPSYDKEGNIVRDEIKITTGSFIETHVFTYEYEFH